MSLEERFRMNMKRTETHKKQFHKIFGQQLSFYMNMLTGFDLVKFDRLLKVPGGISTKEWIREKYGDEAVILVETLIKSGG